MEYNFKTTNQKEIFEKDYSREFSFFYISILQKALAKRAEVYSKRLVEQIYIKHNSIFEVWTDSKDSLEWSELFSKIADENSKFIKDYCEKVLVYWRKLKPYLENKKKIQNIKELRKVYRLIIDFICFYNIGSYLVDLPKKTEKDRSLLNRLRLETQEYTQKIDRLFIDFFIRNFPDYTDLVFILSPEKVFLLENRDLNEREVKEVKKRLNGFALLKGKITLKGDFERELKKNNKILKEDYVMKKEEIKGQPVYPGKVKGKVRIIRTEKDIHQIKKGEIIVSPVTSPDLVLSLEKVVAIVTDEGGITCHAAIIAREMKIPCIVGTRIATQILKDGDLVEVNAIQGVVKILKCQT